MTVNEHLLKAQLNLKAAKDDASVDAHFALRCAEVQAQVAQAVTLDWLATMMETWIGVTVEGWDQPIEEILPDEGDGRGTR